MSVKKALITGVTGQDGSYLAELLLSKGYDVHGMICPDSGNQRALIQAVNPHHADLRDADAIAFLVSRIRPDECYHLAAHTLVITNPSDEADTFVVNAVGTHYVLLAILRHAPECRLFLAGSSEMFGAAERSPQTEETPLRARSVYGVSRVAAYHLMRHYRESRELYACCGMLYNHESRRRGEQFVTGKITAAAARIKARKQQELRLGNLEAVRDWGHARDYVRAMWLMLQQPVPDDYVVATGEGHTVREFVEQAFGAVGLSWTDMSSWIRLSTGLLNRYHWWVVRRKRA